MCFFAALGVAPDPSSQWHLSERSYEPVARSGAIFLGQTNPNSLCAEDIPLPMIEFDKYSEKEVIQQQRFLARLRLAIERGMVHCTRVVI